MSAFAGLYDIRDAKEEDKNFILATFLRGLYYGDSWFSQTDKKSFMTNYKKFAESLLTSNRVVVKVACLKEDADVILGYSILSADFQAIHWVFVKQVWRQKGIAKSLIPSRPQAVTHLTSLGKELLNKFETKPIFDPYKI